MRLTCQNWQGPSTKTKGIEKASGSVAEAHRVDGITADRYYVMFCEPQKTQGVHTTKLGPRAQCIFVSLLLLFCWKTYVLLLDSNGAAMLYLNERRPKMQKKNINIFGAFASPGTILGGCWREKVVSDFGFCFMLHNCPLDFAQSNTSWQLLLLRLLLLELDWHASATAANETSLYCSCYPPSCCYSGGETMQFKEADNTMRGVWIVKAGYSSNMF